MGTEGDMNDRMTLQRVDDQAHRKKIDLARKLIYQRGAPVDGKRVKSILNSESLVPTRISCSFYIQITTTNKLQNAFSDQLFKFGFNFFLMLVVDMLHEFELGVWKAIFTHLMRIVYAAGGVTVQELNWRYIFFIQFLVLIHDVLLQIPLCTDIWERYNPTVSQERFCNEAPRCPRF
jgi:hypothetical protein